MNQKVINKQVPEIKPPDHFIILLLVSFLLLNDSSQLYAQTPSYSNEFLSAGVDARALGMGNAFISVSSDATSGYWNPAGLLRLKPNIQLALMHSEYFAGIAQFDYGAVAFNNGNRNVVGFSFLRMGVDDIPDTSELIDAEGNVNYDRIRSFSSADNAFIISFARKLNDNLNFGINTKIIRRTAGSFAGAWGFGLDAGLQYQHNKWRFAAVGRDITSTFNSWTYDIDDRMREVLTITGNEIPESSTEITLPRIILGASYEHRWKNQLAVLASADLHITTDGKRNVLIKGDPFSIDPSLGMEVSYRNLIFIRAGAGNYQQYTHTNEQMRGSVQFNVGLGVQIGDILQVDYALTDAGNNSVALYSNVFSVKLNIFREEISEEVAE